MTKVSVYINALNRREAMRDEMRSIADWVLAESEECAVSCYGLCVGKYMYAQIVWCIMYYICSFFWRHIQFQPLLYQYIND